MLIISLYPYIALLRTCRVASDEIPALEREIMTFASVIFLSPTIKSVVYLPASLCKSVTDSNAFASRSPKLLLD